MAYNADIPDSKQPQICILGGDLENPNRGVQALSLALIENFSNARPGSRIGMLFGNRSGGPKRVQFGKKNVTVDILNYRLSPRAPLREHLFWLVVLAAAYRLVPIASVRKALLASNPRLQALAQSELVGDIRGGDSFSDIYGLRNFLIGSIPSLATILVEGNLVLLPQTIGPFRSSLAKAVARYILSHANQILVRDQESHTAVQTLVSESAVCEKTTFCPDVAFTLPSLTPASPDIRPPLPLHLESPLIGINISALLYIGGYSEDNMFKLRFNYRDFVLQLVRTILVQTPTRLLLIPHHFGPAGIKHSDLTSCRELLSGLSPLEKARVHLVTTEYDARELKGIIGKCDFFIGSRMHACIAAVSQGIPTVAIAYSRKFIGVFDSIGAGEMVLDARSVESSEALKHVLKRLADLHSDNQELHAKIITARSLVTTLLGRLLPQANPRTEPAEIPVAVPSRCES